MHSATEEEIDHARYYSMVSEELAGGEILVVTRDGGQQAARGIQIRVDSTSWFDPADQLVTMATSEVTHVVRIDRDRGRAQGAGIGVVTGMAVGGVGVMAMLGNDCCLGVYPAMIVGVGAIAGALPGVIIGAMVGEREGARIVYEISQ